MTPIKMIIVLEMILIEIEIEIEKLILYGLTLFSENFPILIFENIQKIQLISISRKNSL